MTRRVSMPERMVAAVAFASAAMLALGLMLLAPPSHAQAAPAAAGSVVIRPVPHQHTGG